MWRRADDSVKIELQKFEAGLSDENLNRVKEVHELSRLLGSGRTCSSFQGLCSRVLSKMLIQARVHIFYFSVLLWN